MRLALLIALLGCGDAIGASTLHVDLRTDFVPAVEFDSVEIVARTLLASHDVVAETAYSTGARVASFDGLSHGEVRLEVSLLLRGERVASRSAILDHDGTTGITITITRRCRDVSCAEGSTCVDGRCLDPRCLDGQQLECDVDACEASCTAADCASARCIHGLCIRAPNAGACAPVEYCDPELGCRRRPDVPTPDAGPPDAGAPDAGPPDAGRPDAGPDAICSPADADVVALYTVDDTDVDALGGDVLERIDATFADGICGRAMSVAGTARAVLDDGPRWNLASGSVDVWFILDGDSSAQRFVFSRDHNGSTPPGQLSAWVTRDNHIAARLQDGGDEIGAIRCGPEVTVDEWHHLGLNFGAEGFELWLDGVSYDLPGETGFDDLLGDPASVACQGPTTSGLAGSTGELHWFLGAGNVYSSPGDDEELRDHLQGRLDHFRISSVRRDFSTFR